MVIFFKKLKIKEYFMTTGVKPTPQPLSADRLNQFQARQSSINANGTIRNVVIVTAPPSSDDSLSVSAQKVMAPPLPPRNNETIQKPPLEVPAQTAMKRPALPPRPNANPQQETKRGRYRRAARSNLLFESAKCFYELL